MASVPSHRSRPRVSNAGASAHARYRTELAAGRPRRLALRAVMTAAAGVAGWLLVGWQAGLALAVIAAVADTVYRWRRHEAVRTWRRGALGERRTARRLRRLERAGYLVLHDRALPYGRANVDHLAIGPTGVFVIDSKVWHRDRRITRRGRYVNVGRRWGSDEVRSAAYEATSVAKALSKRLATPIEVTPVLAVHGPYVPLRGLTVDGVKMLRATVVPSWIMRRKTRITPDLITRLQSAAEDLFPIYTEQPSSPST
ncbi:nuclease-related domain-containing protein [Spongiactinospora sp. TRM90649]|uniref:nuclease-related domain-containing protein n=1 Tax=Spongiactinospora sp. TRM90649 TaxID=3031114 RepID=UPI0023F9A67A|nr:nuclease-related domain-containing protein [Spongiactinospora sp. TRM90649]MDF5751387.1 nuclease-related domain-containing protein [Spongiactinospora sp. TRM90649]